MNKCKTCGMNHSTASCTLKESAKKYKHKQAVEKFRANVRLKTIGTSEKSKSKKKSKINLGLVKDTVKGIPASARRLGRNASQTLIGGTTAIYGVPGGAQTARSGIKDTVRALRGQSDTNDRDYLGNKKPVAPKASALSGAGRIAKAGLKGLRRTSGAAISSNERAIHATVKRIKASGDMVKRKSSKKTKHKFDGVKNVLRTGKNLATSFVKNATGGDVRQLNNAWNPSVGGKAMQAAGRAGGITKESLKSTLKRSLNSGPLRRSNFPFKKNPKRKARAKK